MAKGNNTFPKTNYRFVCFFSFGAIGDLLMTIYMAEQVHRISPDTTIIIFGLKNPGLLREFCAGYPYIHVTKSTNDAIGALLRAIFAKTLAIIPESFGRLPTKVYLLARILCLAPGSLSVESSFRTQKNFFADQIYSFDIERPLYKNMGDMLDCLGFGNPPGKPTFVFEEEIHMHKKLGLVRQEYIVLHPFAANPKRSLPASRWIQIVSQIKEEHPGASIVITGSRIVQAAADKLAQGVGKEKLLNVCGVLNIKELATLIREAKLYIGVDTGITHLAATLRVPSVVVASLSNPTWLPVYNENALILYNKEHCTCDGAKGGNCVSFFEGNEYYRCMLEVTNSRIVKAVNKFMQSRQKTKITQS